MKLLIITQKVDKNDDLLGFFHSWVSELSEHFDDVFVISLGVGEYHLPNNVKVFSLGKPANGRSASGGESLLRRFNYIVRFYKYIWRERKNYDAVLAHMNPIYIVL